MSTPSEYSTQTSKQWKWIARKREQQVKNLQNKIEISFYLKTKKKQS